MVEAGHIHKGYSDDSIPKEYGMKGKFKICWEHHYVLMYGDRTEKHPD